MKVGPVEVIVCTFPQGEMSEAVIDSLGEAVGSGAVAIIDLVLVTRDGQGMVTIRDLGDEISETWSELIVDPSPYTLLSSADVELASLSVGNDQAAVIAAVEHRWARRLSEEVRESRGATVLHARIPHSDVVEAFVADGVAAS